MMKHNFQYLLLILTFCLSFSPVLNAQSTSPEQLKDALAEAMKLKDKEKISSLFNWDGVDNQMKVLSKRNIDQMAEYPAQRIELLPLPEGFKTEFIRNGTKYIPNVKLVGILRIVYGDDGPESITDASIPYGIKDGKYYLPNTVTEQTSYKGPEDKTININVLGTSAPDPVLFEGSCNYTVSGEKKKKIIKGKGNMSEAFWGQEVESCNIKRLSDSGSLKLIISVGDKTVFESEMEETAQITYP